MDALFNEYYKEEEKKRKSKSKKKQDEQTTKKLDEVFGATKDTCNKDELNSFNLDEELLKDYEEDENIGDDKENCYECMYINCDMHPLHNKVLVDKIELPLHIGGCLADEILSVLYKSLGELIEAKELTDEEDDELRKILEEVGYKLVDVVNIINNSRHKVEEAI